MKNSILIVDDEAAQRQMLSAVLEKSYNVQVAAGGAEARDLLKARSYDLVVTDERMPGMTGIELITWISDNMAEIPVIVLTAYGSIKTAVEAMKLGAQDYLTKPLSDPEELRFTVAKVLQQRVLRDQNIVSLEDTNHRFPSEIIGESAAMKQVLQLAAKVAAQSTTVLLTGASGVGKEIIARYIHRRSPRCDHPFVAVNCAALTGTLLASELFGHEKGAFTGASASKRGRFELAHGGTLFLDEIGEMSIDLQATLLRALQEQQFERVGGTRTITVDVRVIAATNRDLANAIADKSFREDLFYRLNVFSVHIPALCDRRDDIVPLATAFVNDIAARMGQSRKTLGPQAAQLLRHYHWPGNVRELQNALERALIMSSHNEIGPDDLPIEIQSVSLTNAEGHSLADIEKTAILDTLAKTDGDRRAAADLLGISLRTLQSRLKDYGMTRGM